MGVGVEVGVGVAVEVGIGVDVCVGLGATVGLGVFVGRVVGGVVGPSMSSGRASAVGSGLDVAVGIFASPMPPAANMRITMTISVPLCFRIRPRLVLYHVCPLPRLEQVLNRALDHDDIPQRGLLGF